MADLSHYRLNSYSEIIDLQHQIGNDKFYKYLNAIYTLAEGINIGQRYPIEQHVKTANRNVFIKCICLYILEMGSRCNVEFTNDYSSVHGIETFDNHSKYEAMIRNKRKSKKKDGKESE